MGHLKLKRGAFLAIMYYTPSDHYLPSWTLTYLSMYTYDSYNSLGYTYNLVILFLSNHNVHKSSCGLCFWAPDSLIDRFQVNSVN